MFIHKINLKSISFYIKINCIYIILQLLSTLRSCNLTKVNVGNSLVMSIKYYVDLGFICLTSGI